MDFIKEIDTEMSKIQYGWVDENGERHTRLTGFSEKYRLQLPEQLQKSHLGVCWDQVELQRKLFSDAGILTRSFFIVHYDGNKCPTHTFTIFEYDGKTYWYEHAWEVFRGLHEYDNFRDAIIDIRNKFIRNELSGEFDPQNLVIYEYGTPKKYLSCQEFYNHCENEKQINLESL